MIFNQARGIARKFAFVHIASAKFELETLGKSSLQTLMDPSLWFDTINIGSGL